MQRVNLKNFYFNRQAGPQTAIFFAYAPNWNKAPF